MKTKKQIQEKMKALHLKANPHYIKELKKSKSDNLYAYGQYMILGWVLGDSSIDIMKAQDNTKENK